MWGPGIAAIIVTLAIEKQPFKSLRLNTLGPKRYYLWAWFLPPLLIVLSGLLTILIRTGQLDTEFTFMQQAMEQTGTQLPISTGMLVLIQIAQALVLGPLINVIFTMGEELGWRGFLLPRLIAARSMESPAHQRRHLGNLACARHRAGTQLPGPSHPRDSVDDRLLHLAGHHHRLDVPEHTQSLGGRAGAWVDQRLGRYAIPVLETRF